MDAKRTAKDENRLSLRTRSGMTGFDVFFHLKWQSS